MDEEEQPNDLFCQDGVVLHSAPATYANFYKTSGTFFITEYANKEKFIEWKSNDVTIESEVQDQEWAVVNAVRSTERRIRTLSGSTIDNTNSRIIKINMNQVKSFKASKKHDKLKFIGGNGETIIGFLFQHGNCSSLVGTLKSYYRTSPSKRDKNLNVILDDDIESQKLTTSMNELNLFQDEPAVVWKFLRNLQSRPYETTMETFSKVADIGNNKQSFLVRVRVLNQPYFIVLSGESHRELEDDVQELISKGIANVENTTTTTTQDEYEVILRLPKLPPRKEYPRGSPLSIEGWIGLQDFNSRIEEPEAIKLLIFRGVCYNTMFKFKFEMIHYKSREYN